MAGPMKWFRKHKTQSLVILTLMAMLSFVFFPMVIQLIEVSRGGSTPRL